MSFLRTLKRNVPWLYPRIVGTASYFPEKVWSNEDLCRLYSPKRPDLTLVQPEWIEKRLGIRNRHLALTPDGYVTEDALDMAVKVSKKALEDAKVDVKDVGCVVYITPTPSLGEFQQDTREFSKRMGLSEDCNLVHHHIGCPALTTGFKTVWGEILLNRGRRYVLLVDSTSVSATMKDPVNAKIKYMEGLHNCVTPHPWAWLTAFLFADGAAAAVFGASRSRGIFDVMGYHNPELEIMIQRGGTSNQFMTRDEMGKDAYITVPETVAKNYVPTLLRMDDILTGNHIDLLREGKPDSVECKVGYDFCFVHQANQTLVDKLIGELRQRPHYENCIFPTHAMEKGNISGGCTIALLDEMRRSGIVQKGDLARFLVIGAGNGGSYGGATVVL